MLAVFLALYNEIGHGARWAVILAYFEDADGKNCSRSVTGDGDQIAEYLGFAWQDKPSSLLDIKPEMWKPVYSSNVKSLAANFS